MNTQYYVDFNKFSVKAENDVMGMHKVNTIIREIFAVKNFSFHIK